VVVRVPEDLVDQAKAVVDTIALERGLGGKLVILGEPGIMAGDFCIEWADGGIQRDGAALERAIAAAMARHFDGDALRTAGDDRGRGRTASLFPI
jgi:flagellar assembly protein FliH